MTLEEAEKKVYNLTTELLKTKLDCKDVVTGYKERIKDIESEIKAIIDDYNSNGSVAAAP